MKLYCVVYRIGGTENFEWKRSLPTNNREEAQKTLDATLKAGYRAFIVDYRASMSIGLPDTFSA